MFCVKCGNKVIDTAKFCDKCGIKLSANGGVDFVLVPEPKPTTWSIPFTADAQPT